MSATGPVITAWSAVSAFGVGREPFTAGVRGGRPVVTDLDRERWPAPVGRACLVPGGDPRELLGRKGTRSMDRVTGLAVAAVGRLLDDGSGERIPGLEEDTGLVLGTSNGSVSSIMTFTRDSLTEERPYLVDPTRFPNTVMNCAAGQSAIRHGLRGPNVTIAGGRASALLALNHARRLQHCGHARSVVCGAAEEFSPERAWLDWHARTEQEPTEAAGTPGVGEAARTGQPPFAGGPLRTDEGAQAAFKGGPSRVGEGVNTAPTGGPKSGAEPPLAGEPTRAAEAPLAGGPTRAAEAPLTGEGCAVLLLETEVGSSGRPALAEVTAVEIALPADEKDAGPVLADCVRRALHRSGLTPADLWALAPAGTPGPYGAQEHTALAEVLGGHDPLRLSCTDLLGDAGAASAAFQIAALLATAEGDPTAHGRAALVTTADPDGVVGCAVLRLA
ncbi:beta-ketoacyl synthase N-terminal-like domain-containing protein [Streptomyces sp. CA-249302]|uniref:beta-ketoacyl synthase N-terminal-like domain-containing protein n=1 Tax=Streptomyces sp. CA-249302 TaxID=3240058 RepID=UPI003D8ACBFB